MAEALAKAGNISKLTSTLLSKMYLPLRSFLLSSQEKMAQEYHRPEPSLSLLAILCGPAAEQYMGHRGQGKKACQMPTLCRAPSYVLDV